MRLTRATPGNRGALVLMDSSDELACHVAGVAVLSLLRHMGLPHYAADLAGEAPPQKPEIGLVLLAQDGLGSHLPQQWVEFIGNAAHAGAGLVSFDGRPDLWPPELQRLFGLRAAGTPAEVASLRDLAPDSWVTALREAGTTWPLRSPVPVAPVQSAPGAVPLLDSAVGPAAWLHEGATYRAAAWATSAVLWCPDYLGHAAGLDDLCWRAIVWAMPKPVLLHCFPPFLTVRVGGATGAADGFAWVGALAQHGLVPEIGLLTDEVPPPAWQQARRLQEAGRARFSAEAFTAERLIYAGDHTPQYPANHVPALPDDELERRLTRAHAQLARAGLRPSAVAVPRFCEYGSNVPDRLLERGQESICTPFLPNETLGLEHEEWAPQPYGHGRFLADFLPDFPDLLAFAAGASEPTRDLDAGALARTVALGLDSLFWGCLALEERELLPLGVEGVGELLKAVLAALGGREWLPATLEDVAHCARGKATVDLTSAAASRGTGELRWALSAPAPCPLMLSLFTEARGEVVREHVGVPAGERRGVHRLAPL